MHSLELDHRETRIGYRLPNYITPLLVAVGLLVGCGRGPHEDKEVATVEVTVTYDGQPVTQGFVNFENDTGLGGGGELNEAGTTRIEKMPTGDYVVYITPPDPDPVPGNATVELADFSNIPETVRTARTSPHKATVDPGENSFDIEIKP